MFESQAERYQYFQFFAGVYTLVDAVVQGHILQAQYTGDVHDRWR